MRTPIRPALLCGAALLIAPLCSSCFAVAAGAAAGLVVSKEVVDNNAYISRVNRDVISVWAIVKTTLSSASTELIDVDDNRRVASGLISGARVTVNVEAYDLEHTTLRVTAERYYVNDGEIAGDFMDRILAELGQS
jgi:hypothetical protein